MSIAATRRTGASKLIEEMIRDARGDFGSISPGKHVFIGDDHAVGLAHGCGDRVPVKRRERTEVDDFHRHAFVLELRRGDLGSMDHGAVRNDADVLAFTNDAGPAERNGEVRTGIGRPVIGLAIQMLVFEE